MSAEFVTVDRGLPAPTRRGAKVLAFAVGLAVAIGPYLLLRPRLATFLGTTHLISVADRGGGR
jgi:hypothetical protein